MKLDSDIKNEIITYLKQVKYNTAGSIRSFVQLSFSNKICNAKLRRRIFYTEIDIQYIHYTLHRTLGVSLSLYIHTGVRTRFGLFRRRQEVVLLRAVALWIAFQFALLQMPLLLFQSRQTLLLHLQMLFPPFYPSVLKPHFNL